MADIKTKDNHPEFASDEALLLVEGSGRFGFFDWDIKANTSVWSRGLEKLYGVPAGTGSSSNWLGLIHPDHRDRAVSQPYRAMELRLPDIQDDIQIIKPDGEVRWIRHRGVITYDADGVPTRMLGIGADITEERRALDDLRESEARYRWLFENMHEGLAFCRVSFEESGDKTDWEYLAVNEAFKRITGFTNPVGKRLSELLPPGMPMEPEILEFYKQVALTGEQRTYDRFVTALGVHIRATAYSPQAGHFVAVIEDITSQKEAESKLIAYAEELEEQAAIRAEKIRKLEQMNLEIERRLAIGRMAAKIAHEINNPLTTVKNSLAIMGGRGTLDKQLLDLMRSEIDRIAKIVSQIYGYFGQSRDNNGEFDIVSTLREMILLRDMDIRARGLTVKLESAEPKIVVSNHKNSFQQIFLDIFQNALEAAPSGSCVSIYAALKGKEMEISVSDEGEGIPIGLRGRVFEPFFSTKIVGKQQGLGLGLAIARDLATTLGGTVFLDEGFAPGAKFVIKLPTEMVAEPAASVYDDGC